MAEATNPTLMERTQEVFAEIRAYYKTAGTSFNTENGPLLAGIILAQAIDRLRLSIEAMEKRSRDDTLA